MYEFTTKNVESVVKGLKKEESVVEGSNNKPEDTIDNIIVESELAIMLALSEYTLQNGKTVLIDRDWDRLNRSKELYNSICSGDYQAFHDANIAPRNRNYFSDARLELIKDNKNIEFLYADICSLNSRSEFSKVYLSSSKVKPQVLSNIMQKGGLVYIPELPWKRFDENSNIEITDESSFKEMFETYHGGTLIAKCLECAGPKEIVHPAYKSTKTPEWNPIVFRKI